jgi:hypothetical protein
MNELPTSAMGVMRQLSVSKPGIQIFSKQLIDAVLNGEVNALELKAFFKAMESIIETVNEATKESQLRESERYPEKLFTAFGCKIEKAEVGVKYDYSICGDPVYKQRLQILEEAQKQLDERAAFLKALKEPLTLVDDESGEVATVRPPLKKGTQGLKFSIQ